MPPVYKKKALQEARNNAYPLYSTTRIKKEANRSVNNCPIYSNNLENTQAGYSYSTSDDGSSTFTIGALPSQCCLPPISELLKHPSNLHVVYPPSADVYDNFVDHRNLRNTFNTGWPYPKADPYTNQSFAECTHHNVYAPYLGKSANQHVYYNYSTPSSPLLPPPPPPPSPVKFDDTKVKAQDIRKDIKMPIGPWISYFYHHHEFGIEACMDQLLEARYKY